MTSDADLASTTTKPATATSQPVRYCEAFAVAGTGFSTCGEPLDRYGNCPQARSHRDSHTLREL